MDIWSIITSILSNSIPAVVLMLTGVLLLFLLPHGFGGIKLNERAKKLSSIFGYILFPLGALFTIFVAIQPIQNELLLSLMVIWAVVSRFVSITTILALALVLIGLLSFRWLRERNIELGYKIQSRPVVEENSLELQVTNIGRGEITWMARLVRVTWKSPREERESEREIDVNVFNPRGLFLSWFRRGQSAILEEGIPVVIDVIHRKSHTSYFVFDDEKHYHYSVSLLPGCYAVRIQFLRLKNGKWKEFSMFKGTFLTEYSRLEWLD